jgi:lipopolysaccharide export system permease protein
MVLFGFYALVLVAVFWVNRAVALFDQLISDGHSISVFVEFSILSLPAVIAKILPLATFAASVSVINRLSGESELTVLQAVGFSPWRLARPVLAYGMVITLMMSALTHFLVPMSQERLDIRETQISDSVSAKFLREGVFLHPSDGITFYIREMAPSGELSDVLLSDRRNEGREVTYTSDVAYLISDSEGPKLVMLTGIAQTLNYETRQLSTTDFENFTYSIAGLLSSSDTGVRKIQYVSTPDLLLTPEAIQAETGSTLGRVVEEGHLRFQQPLLCIVAALIGYAALIAGGFSRTGSTPQIIFAVFLIVFVEFSKGMVAEPVRANADLWPLTYAPSVFGGAMVLVLLTYAARSHRRPRKSAPAPEVAP